MKIQGMNETAQNQNVSVKRSSTTDAISKSLENQINQIRQSIQDLANNEELSTEAKQKKKQDLTKKMNELTQELNQHQIELQKKAIEEAKESDEGLMAADENKLKNYEEPEAKVSISKEGMEAFVQAGQSVNESKMMNHVKVNNEGKARVTEEEIKIDQGRGRDTTEKSKELSTYKSAVSSATRSQNSSLKNASDKMQESNEKQDRLTPAQEMELLRKKKEEEQQNIVE